MFDHMKFGVSDDASSMAFFIKHNREAVCHRAEGAA